MLSNTRVSNQILHACRIVEMLLENRALFWCILISSKERGKGGAPLLSGHSIQRGYQILHHMFTQLLSINRSINLTH